jgi:hypothetical protein
LVRQKEYNHRSGDPNILEELSSGGSKKEWWLNKFADRVMLNTSKGTVGGAVTLLLERITG